jgi:hypothetical protein
VITAAPAPTVSPSRRSDWRGRTALALRVLDRDAFPRAARQHDALHTTLFSITYCHAL